MREYVRQALAFCVRVNKEHAGLVGARFAYYANFIGLAQFFRYVFAQLVFYFVAEYPLGFAADFQIFEP